MTVSTKAMHRILSSATYNSIASFALLLLTPRVSPISILITRPYKIWRKNENYTLRLKMVQLYLYSGYVFMAECLHMSVRRFHLGRSLPQTPYFGSLYYKKKLIIHSHLNRSPRNNISCKRDITLFWHLHKM